MPRILNPYAAPGKWCKAQLHCHTTESDGRIPPRDLLRMYQDAGYSFVCITDHNRVTRCDDFNGPEFLTVPGVEDEVGFGLPVLGAHMVRLFVDGPLRTGSAQQRIDRTREEGGVVSLCHPSWPGNLWTGQWSEADVCSLRGYDLMEISNHHSSTKEDIRRWSAALRAHGPAAPIWGIAVDDCHSTAHFNEGWIMVKVAAVSAEALKKALLAGSFYATTGPSLDFAIANDAITVTTVPSGGVRVLDAAEVVRLESQGDSIGYAPVGDERYVRVELRTEIGQAWSQPFWIEI